MSDDPAAIDAELRALHGGPNATRLSELHEVAAGIMTDAAARRFHLTHAWIYALVAGDAYRSDRLADALQRCTDP